MISKIHGVFLLLAYRQAAAEQLPHNVISYVDLAAEDVLMD